jgi:hypothetical protein
MMSEIKLPGTPFTALARQRGKAKGLDFEGGRERAERVIQFIQVRALDIDRSPQLERWVVDAIYEAFEIGPEAMIETGEQPD